MISRRSWLRAIAAAVGGAGATLAARRIAAQEPERAQIADTSNLFPMDQSAARSVRLPPKPTVAPAMTPNERDALEHQIRCQCGCTLDVYTCRTTDFTCQVSPQMHRDILALVQNGYDEPEILDAFVNVYGDRVLMAPPKVGFNILGYVLPGIAVAVGALALPFAIRRLRRPSAPVATATRRAPLDATLAPPATPDEIAQLDAAIRDDS